MIITITRTPEGDSFLSEREKSVSCDSLYKEVSGMNEPIFMIEIQMDYDRVRADNKFDADKMKEYIRDYFNDEEDIYADEREENTFFMICENEHQYGTLWSLAFGLYEQEWFKSYVKRFYYYNCDEVQIYGDAYVPENIIKELSEINYPV